MFPKMGGFHNLCCRSPKKNIYLQGCHKVVQNNPTDFITLMLSLLMLTTFGSIETSQVSQELYNSFIRLWIILHFLSASLSDHWGSSGWWGVRQRHRVDGGLLLIKVLGSISPTFYAQLLRQQSFASKVQTYNVTTKKLGAQLTYVKAAFRTFGEIDHWSQSYQAFFFV